jgi:hypothetical protein
MNVRNIRVRPLGSDIVDVFFGGSGSGAAPAPAPAAASACDGLGSFEGPSPLAVVFPRHLERTPDLRSELAC